MRHFILAIVAIFISFTQTGCASFAQKWKALISEDAPQATAAAQQARPQQQTYSDQSNLTPPVYRKYQRTTRKEFEDQAQVDARAGSLWVMEGQGSYLFAQNVVRMIGDPIAITLEGEPHKQLDQKAEVISTLLKQLDQRRQRALTRDIASQNTNAAPVDNQAAAPTPAPVANNLQNQAAKPDAPTTLSVKQVPTRIVERLVDGNYRVKGMQPFMIGEREYRVIVSGIVKSEDFNENGISATQLLDPSFDIVSSKSAEM